MEDKDTKRIVRLIAILTQLQSTRLITASKLAVHFKVSTRTIYRDINTLEQAGVPIISEEGKGYTLMEGYRFPPVMLNENETNALITAEKLITRNKDESFVAAFTEALIKIKAVLRYSLKDKADLLADRVYFGTNETKERTSNYLSTVQYALTNFFLIDISYKDDQGNVSFHLLESFGLVHCNGNWVLLAFCRLRGDYSLFRLDYIQKMVVTNDHFEPLKISLQQYLQKFHNTSINV